MFGYLSTWHLNFRLTFTCAVFQLQRLEIYRSREVETQEVKDAKRGETKLRCGECNKTRCTKRSAELLKCVGCTYEKGSEVKLGRQRFSKKALSNARNQKIPLLCDKCKERERSMLDKIRTVDGNGKCPCSSTWGHTATCFFSTEEQSAARQGRFKMASLPRAESRSQVVRNHLLHASWPTRGVRYD